MKKFLAVTLTLALTLALFAFPLPASAAVTTESTSKVLFEDDFDAYNGYTTGGQIKPLMVAKGWEAHTTNTPHSYAKTGSYVSPIGIAETQMVTSLTDTANWSGYAVSSDISFTDVFVSTETETRANTSAVVVLNASELDNGGYEVGLSLDGDDTKKVIIRHRGVKTLAEKEYAFNSDSTVYTVKAEYIAGTINCYVNGNLELSYNTSNDDVMLTKGSAGFRKVSAKGNSAEITFDNFKVEKAEKTVWFSEDFLYDSAAEVSEAGWDNSEIIYGNIQDESFNLVDTANYYTVESEQTYAWDDYIVESDFNVTRGTGTRQWFGVSGRMNGEDGYVFMLYPGSVSNPEITARIRRYVGGAGTNIVSLILDDDFVEGNYKLELEMIGNKLNGYVNGKLVCSGTDDTYTRGGAGYYTSTGTGFNVVADNFVVTGYQPYTEYFNQDFNNATAESLINTGYTFISDDAASAITITDGAITFPTTTQKIGLFSQEINSSTYTVKTDFTVKDVSGSATVSYGILIGADSTEYNNCYFCEARVNKNGQISATRIRKITGGSAGGALGTTTNNSSITMGTTVSLVVEVSYDETTKTTTVIFKVLSGDEEASNTTYTTTAPTDIADEGVKIVGRAALYKNTTASNVSYDNFTAYSVNSYVSSIIGDMDGDGIVTAADGRYIRSYVLGLSEAAADLNSDTATDIRDLVHFKKVFEFYK